MRRPLLFPLVPLYAAGLALRELRLQRSWECRRRLQSPVISVGNLSAGGSGKTPFTITLARLLRGRGFQVDVLSRGYGRRSSIALRVDPNGTSDQYGDEPLLIAREEGVPVYVAAERYDAGMLAESDELGGDAPCVHILDDGFQHRQLARDVDILLLDQEDWHDNLLPAGNLRENRSAAKRASVIAIPAEDPSFENELRSSRFAGPVWRIRRRMEVPRIDGPVFAFCGIARPEQFFAGLAAAGMTVSCQYAFADHHRYTTDDVQSLLVRARKSGSAALVTTKKDVVRLGKLTWDFPSDLPLKTVGLSIAIEDEATVLDWIASRISSEGSGVGR